MAKCRIKTEAKEGKTLRRSVRQESIHVKCTKNKNKKGYEKSEEKARDRQGERKKTGAVCS